MAFTSDLSIDEVLLVEEVGFEPVDLVIGSSYFHIGWQYAPWTTNEEMTDVSDVMRRARRLAMARLQEQVDACGADGVVGVRIDVEREGHHAEFTAVGTAVRRRDGDGAAWRDRRGLPFTSNLSGQDFWALARGGLRPVGLAFGVCVYHIAHATLSGWLQQLTANAEHIAFTQGLYDARELAMGRMQHEAHEAGAEGVVGVTVTEGSHGWDSHVREFLALGCAVARIGAGATAPDPSLTRIVLAAED
jgi:uncharacterized protein YbjQ (UPF0145 family)